MSDVEIIQGSGETGFPKREIRAREAEITTVVSLNLDSQETWIHLNPQRGLNMQYIQQTDNQEIQYHQPLGKVHPTENRDALMQGHESPF